ncbi:prepilin-type N-terminal cleavage/methylation domain-containing protein [Gemmatimonadota bacterium]
MTVASQTPRRGFTLIEVLIVVVVLGILAGLALPSLQTAIWKAHAADVLGDVHVARLAYHQYLADGGGRTRTRPWRRIPPDIESFLPDGFSFENDVAEYRWVRVSPGASPWGVESALFRVRPKPSVRRIFMTQLTSMASGPYVIPQRNQILFYFTP